MWLFSCHLRFYVKSILRNLDVLRLTFFYISRTMDFVDLINFRFQKVQKFIKIKIRSFWQILSLYIRQLWFHVKSYWQKNAVISTVYDPQCGNETIFLPLRFYVKSNFVRLKSQNLLFQQFQQLWVLLLVNYCILSELKLAKYQNLKPVKLTK